MRPARRNEAGGRPGPLFHINTAIVGPNEIRSCKDLPNPKWKGKISTQEPTVPGTGSNAAARLHIQFGDEFVKKSFIDQKPVISCDTRQLTDGPDDDRRLADG